MVLGPFAEFSTASLVLGSIGSYLVLSLALSYLRARRYPADIKTVGAGKGFLAAFKEMKLWAQEGYDVYNKQSKAYILPGVLGNDPQVIIPRSQMSWMLDQPDHVLSTSGAHYDIMHGDYSFVTPDLLRNPYHEHVIHRSLARHLNALVPELEAEVKAATDDIFGFDDKEWKTFTIWDALMKFIPRVTNRMLIGLPVCRTQGYLDNMVAITDDVVRNMPLLGIVPPILKPLLGPIASLPAKYHYQKTAKYSMPVIKKRLADFERKESGDPDYADWVPPNDYISWHIAAARAENNVVELQPTRIAQRLIPINFASIHTTALTALNTFLDILSSDAQYGTLAALTEEIRRVYAEEGGHWTKAGLGRLYRLDSAIRESMRFSAIAQTLVQKKVVAKEGLTNPETGWHFEYGTMLACPLWGSQHDREFFGDDADTYDPLRFSRGREEFEARGAEEKNADERLKLQKTGMVTTSTTHFPFGHGRHACPGRFFVAHELKMFFAHLLLNYDLMPKEKRPEIKWVAAFVMPPMKETMQVRRRTKTI